MTVGRLVEVSREIFFHFFSVNGLRRSHRRLVKEILVPDAVAYWEDVLTVVNRGDTIRVNRKCANNQYFLADGEATQYCKNKCVDTYCGEYKVPDAHLEVRAVFDNSCLK